MLLRTAVAVARSVYARAHERCALLRSAGRRRRRHDRANRVAWSIASLPSKLARGRSSARQQRLAGIRGHATAASLVKLSGRTSSRASYALGVLGMPGFTAFVGLLDIGEPQPGETLVVAAATGAVGLGRRSDREVEGLPRRGHRRRRGEVRAGPCMSSGSMTASTIAPRRSTPSWPPPVRGGIDIYYENVGGKVFRAVLPLLNAHARIPVCGLISQYNESPQQSPGDSLMRLMRAILVKRLSVRGFIISDGHDHRRPDFLDSMVGWLRGGQDQVPGACGPGTRERARGLSRPAWRAVISARWWSRSATLPRRTREDEGLGRRCDRAAARRADGRGRPLDRAGRHARNRSHAERRLGRGARDRAPLVAAADRRPLRARQ